MFEVVYVFSIAYVAYKVQQTLFIKNPDTSSRKETRIREKYNLKPDKLFIFQYSISNETFACVEVNTKIKFS